MQVSIAPPPGKAEHFKCHDCDTSITTSHVLTQTDRKTRRFCNAGCYGHWRKQTKEAA